MKKTALLTFAAASALSASTITMEFTKVGFVATDPPYLTTTLDLDNQDATLVIKAASIEWVEINGVVIAGVVPTSDIEGFSVTETVPNWENTASELSFAAQGSEGFELASICYTAATPEPTSMGLIGGCLTLIGVILRRRKK